MTKRTPQRGRRIGAFFDFDRTVIQGDAGVAFGRELVRIRWRRLVDQDPGTLAWAARIVAHAWRVAFFWLRASVVLPLYWAHLVKRSTIVRMGFRTMKGWSLEEIEAFASSYFDEVLVARLFPDAIKTIEKHRELGHIVVVATTNMHILVDNLMRHAPVSHVIANRFEVRDGRLTGKIFGPSYGREKAEAVRKWAHEHDVRLPMSHGYTDHYSDHAFLRLFGYPHAVNANRRLDKVARKRGWKRVIFGPPPDGA